MKALKKIAKINAVWALLAAAIVIAVWLIAYACVKNDYVIPGIGQTFSALFSLLGDRTFYVALGNTVARTAISFAISFVLAAVFASVSAVCRPFKVTFACLISVVRTLPTMAITLMLLIWTSPRVAPAIVTALVLFPMIYAQFTAAIDGVDSDLLEMAKLYRLSAGVRLTKIILPSVAAEVLAQVGAWLSLGLKIMVSAEVLSYTLNSFGGMMQQARLFSEMPRFAALTLMCIEIGLLLEIISYGLRLAVLRRKGGE